MPVPLQPFVFCVPKHCGATIRWKIPKKAPKPRKNSKTSSPKWNSSPYPLPRMILFTGSLCATWNQQLSGAVHEAFDPLIQARIATKDF
jgi:hypothetical protein